MLHRFETYAVASSGLLDLLEALLAEDNEEGFAQTRSAQAGLARSLLDDGVPAADVIGVVSEINLDIHRRCVERALAAAPSPPPVPFTLLVMGSAGRGESFLFPDQDNGLILGERPDELHAAVDAWFIPFAEDLNARLARAGFTLCKGCDGAQPAVAQDAQRVEAAVHPLDGTSFACGTPVRRHRVRLPPRLGPRRARCRAPSASRAGACPPPAFLAALAAEDAKFAVGLSFWGGFRDDEEGPGRRTDLKLHGLMPLVSSVRLLALREGIEETSTRGRLAALAASGTISASERSALDAAFGIIVERLLRQQLDDLAAGREAGNLVDTAALAKADRSALRDALKAVATFQKGTRAALTGGL